VKPLEGIYKPLLLLACSTCG